jgi:hypothetical protein
MMKREEGPTAFRYLDDFTILREVRLVERSHRRNAGYPISADGSIGEKPA